VLELLKSPLFSPTASLSFSQLQIKAAMLILISTACRISTLVRLLVGCEFFVKRADHFILYPTGRDKTAKRLNHEIYLFKNVQDMQLSPFDVIERLLVLRPSSPLQTLFFSNRRLKYFLPTRLESG